MDGATVGRLPTGARDGFGDGNRVGNELGRVVGTEEVGVCDGVPLGDADGALVRGRQTSYTPHRPERRFREHMKAPWQTQRLGDAVQLAPSHSAESQQSRCSQPQSCTSLTSGLMLGIEVGDAVGEQVTPQHERAQSER